jgi:hypothetical protein
MIENRAYNFGASSITSAIGISLCLSASDSPVAVVPAPSLSFLVVFVGLNWEQQQGDLHREDGT